MSVINNVADWNTKQIRPGAAPHSFYLPVFRQALAEAEGERLLPLPLSD